MAAAAATMSAALARRRAGLAGVGRSEHGKFLCYFCRSAMRALGAFPVGRADENLAVASALFAMEFVNGHEIRITNRAEISRYIVQESA